VETFSRRRGGLEKSEEGRKKIKREEKTGGRGPQREGKKDRRARPRQGKKGGLGEVRDSTFLGNHHPLGQNLKGRRGKGNRRVGFSYKNWGERG